VEQEVKLGKAVRISGVAIMRAGLGFIAAMLVPLAGAQASAPTQQTYTAAEFSVAKKDFEQIRPRVSGKYVVWQDYRNLPGVVYDDAKTNADIFARDLDANTESKISDKHTAARPAISGNRIVFADNRNKDRSCNGSTCGIDIHGYRIDTGEVLDIVEHSGDQDFPAIDGAIVVWQDNRDGDWDIRGYYFDRDEHFVVVARDGDQIRPSVSGTIVAWEDHRSSDGPDVYARDVTRDDAPARITDDNDSRDPALSIPWLAYRTGDPDGDSQRIKLVNLATGETRTVTDRIRLGSGPRISGNLVVWSDIRNDEDHNVWGYDIGSGTQFRITGADKDQTGPDISGTAVVWEDARGESPRDVRGARLTPSASTTPTKKSATTLTDGSQPAAQGPLSQGPCAFRLGFHSIQGTVPDLVGDCRENEWQEVTAWS
jgi:TolB protein